VECASRDGGVLRSRDGHKGSRCLTAFQVMGPATHRCGAGVRLFGHVDRRVLRLVDFRSRSPADEFVNEVGSKRRTVVRGGIARSPCVLGFGLQIVNLILCFCGRPSTILRGSFGGRGSKTQR